MALSSPPITVAPFDKGRLAAGISASATTCTVSPIYKTVAGVRVKQGLNTTSGCAIISQGDFNELITYTGLSVDSTTKVSTITGMTRGRDPTQTTAAGSFASGTGRVWAKGAKFTVVDDVTYNQSGVYSNVANAFTAANTFAALSTFNAPVIVAGTSSYVKLPELTTTQRDALTPAEGMLLKNSTTGTVQQYVGGAWASIGTDATPNMSTTVAGKGEAATVAEQASHAATGGTGALAVPTTNNLVTLAADPTCISGAIPTLNTSSVIDKTLLGSGSPSATTVLIGTNTWFALPAGVFGRGDDGAKDIAASENLDPTDEYSYTTFSLSSGQTLGVSSVNRPLVVRCTGDATISGAIDLKGKGGAGGAAVNNATTANPGNAGTGGQTPFGSSIGVTVAAGAAGAGGATTGWDGGGGGGGGSLFNAGSTGVNGTGSGSGTGGAGGAVGASSASLLALLATMNRGVVCGGGGASGGSAGNNSAGTSGAGGAGGGALIMFVQGNLTLGAASSIDVRGNNGSAASGSNSSDGGGGGGGGGGGCALIIVNGTITNSGVTNTVTASSGGAGEFNGGAGGAGGAGKIFIYSLSSGTLISA